ncbi:hypothetical protein LTR37_012154 [Vermiconidia calcicola]|uniref:Uncharacterized protein n=1 Tax=Vermiconidia calcicola TaxID=1690605 RepID=A0ACC3MZW3_9PEZI|nr:hypothetical protein LTR37_012154 [Vermiconidia calcicola]
MSLQLSWNKLAILVTRPVLLHVLKSRRSSSDHDEHSIPGTTMALSEACVHYARDSSKLLVDSWLDGSFMIFDYAFTQYMFTSGTILDISSLLRDDGHESDFDNFRCLSQFLAQLEGNGNFLAAEFCSHIDAIERLLAASAVHQSDYGIHSTNQYVSVPECLITQPGIALPELFLGDSDNQALSDLQFIDDSIYRHDLGLYWGNDVSDARDDAPMTSSALRL